MSGVSVSISEIEPSLWSENLAQMSTIGRRTLSNEVPPCRIQWVSRTPDDVATICLSGAVLEEVRRAHFRLVIQCGELVNSAHPASGVWHVQTRKQPLQVVSSRVSIQDVKCLHGELAQQCKAKTMK